MAQLPAIQATRKSGKECFEGMDGENSLQDFWAWAFSDLVSNTERGKLAEYLVAKAMGCGTQISPKWESYDLLCHEGLEIEVKTSADNHGSRRHSRRFLLVSPRQNFGMVLITWGKRNVMRTCMSFAC